MHYVLYTCAHSFSHYTMSVHLSPCLPLRCCNYTPASLQDTRKPLDLHDMRRSVPHANVQDKGNVKVRDDLECTFESQCPFSPKAVEFCLFLCCVDTKNSVQAATGRLSCCVSQLAERRRRRLITTKICVTATKYNQHERLLLLCCNSHQQTAADSAARCTAQQNHLFSLVSFILFLTGTLGQSKKVSEP